jgi:hypothetical protein
LKPKLPTKVIFWIKGEKLFVKNLENSEIFITNDQKEIAMFLNAHNMTVHDVEKRTRCLWVVQT